MEIVLESSILENLAYRGILAYIAVKMATGTEATTAALAGLVHVQTGVMLEGLKDLSLVAPELVCKSDKKWRCGEVKSGNGQVLQKSDSERYRTFVDDLKKFWDYLNPDLPFQMGGKDGTQIRFFLRDHPDWLQQDWRVALNHRKTSIVKFNNAPRTQPLWCWVGILDSYAGGPLNEYGKPATNGKAEDLERRNRESREQYISRL